MKYRATTPWWLRLAFPRGLVWDMPRDTGTVYLTFDDGPHPSATAYVLELLAKYEAQATFFCVGDNVRKYPDVYKSVLQHGHKTANHTYNHLSGWKTDADDYMANIVRAGEYIDSHLFRPPYGKVTRTQVSRLRKADARWRIVMWDVLSGDFDKDLSKEQCVQNVLRNIRPGAIVVFHDSDKAWERMSYALPKVLEYCRENGWKLKAIE